MPKNYTTNWRNEVRDKLCLVRDDMHAETTLHISAKRTSPFKSAGASVQSTTGSRVVHISGSNAGYTTFRGGVKSTGYSLHSPVSPSLPLHCVTVWHHNSNWTLLSLETDLASPNMCVLGRRSKILTPHTAGDVWVQEHGALVEWYWQGSRNARRKPIPNANFSTINHTKNCLELRPVHRDDNPVNVTRHRPPQL